jgi:hypothetical protein
LLLRDAEGQHYEAPRRAYDTTTRLRRQAALAETQSGIVIIIVPARIADARVGDSGAGR